MTVYKREVKTIEFSSEWAGRKISFETGKLAPQADSSIRFQYGDNVILNTVCMSKDPNLDSDFLPLLIDFRESYSAAGRIA
jgi:polyribonucleotide nucleotidyltransferase